MTTTMTVHLHAPLAEYVQRRSGESGEYDSVSEYIRDLIRRDKERSEAQAFERLKAELTMAFAAPDTSYKTLTAADIMARNPSTLDD